MRRAPAALRPDPQRQRDERDTSFRKPSTTSNYSAAVMRAGAAGPLPSVRQSVVLGTTPSNDAISACGTCGVVVPSAGPPSRIVLAASTIRRRKRATAISLVPSQPLVRAAVLPLGYS